MPMKVCVDGVTPFKKLTAPLSLSSDDDGFDGKPAKRRRRGAETRVISVSTF
jgi:hypothetical protein